MTTQFIEDIRRFNRQYTKVLGLLNSGYLDSKFSLTETRILFEVYSHNGCTATDLCTALDLDKGYMSRTLKKFVRDGLLRRSASEQDGRTQHIFLTEIGREAAEEMIALSNGQICDLFGSLSEKEMQEVHHAIKTLLRCFPAQDSRTTEEYIGEKPMNYIVRPYKKGEEVYVADAHRRIYSEEYRWGDSFITYAMKVAIDFAEKEQSDREELWVAEADGKLVGCIMLCQTEDPAVGQLRLFLVEKAYRCYGVGGALIRSLMEKAKETGYKQLILWTADPLDAAIRHYEKRGFRATEKSANDSWSITGETVTEVKMVMEL